MNNAQKAYSFISNESFGKTDIINLGNHVLTNQSIFSKKIMLEHISSKKLPGRLTDASDPNCMPYPFVFSPSRKECFAHLLPSPKMQYTIIEGFSQAGKSNFACILALIYRMKAQSHSVIYIGNIHQFSSDSLYYLKEEIFYWFYEEIERTLIAQTMMSYLVNIYPLKIDIFSKVIYFLSQLAQEKGKNGVLILDQYNKLDMKKCDEVLRILWSVTKYKIYVTTKTDQKVTNVTSRDCENADVQILEESENKIKKDEMKKVIKELFNREKEEDFAESLFEETKGNLTLIFLFFNYCAGKKILIEETSLLDNYKDFETEYKIRNLAKHKKWISKNKVIKMIPRI